MVSVSCFGVRVSLMFHFMFVHYTFSSVWVAEWPLFLHSKIVHLVNMCKMMTILHENDKYPAITVANRGQLGHRNLISDFRTPFMFLAISSFH